MHTLKKKVLSSLPKLLFRMAGFGLTSQISELDNFDLTASFENFVRGTQHKLLTMPVVQCEDDQLTEGNSDISSFKAINFDAPGKETEPLSVKR